MLTVIQNLENIGDIVDKNLMEFRPEEGKRCSRLTRRERAKYDLWNVSRVATLLARLGIRPVSGLVAAGLFLAILIVQSPHLVHHLFEPGWDRTDCALGAGADRVDGGAAALTTLDPLAVVEAVPCLIDGAALPGPQLGLPDPRAPPLLAS